MLWYASKRKALTVLRFLVRCLTYLVWAYCATYLCYELLWWQWADCAKVNLQFESSPSWSSYAFQSYSYRQTAVRTGMTPSSASVRCSLIGQIIQIRAARRTLFASWVGLNSILVISTHSDNISITRNWLAEKTFGTMRHHCCKKSVEYRPCMAWVFIHTFTTTADGASRPRAYFDKHLCMNVPHRLTHHLLNRWILVYYVYGFNLMGQGADRITNYS